MIQPITRLITDTSKTAPAAISLTCFTEEFIEVVNVSESFSMAVFIISSASTSALQNRMASHSFGPILKTIPPKKVIAAMAN